MLGLEKEEILEALGRLGGTATCHEVVREMGLKASWEREKVFTILAAYCDKIPLAELDREYATGGGNTKWAYRLRLAGDSGDLSGVRVDPDDGKLPF